MSKLNLTWQYNGCAPWEEIVVWCANHIENEWYAHHDAHHETIWFYTEADKMVFLLRWA
jgi:hypothetical protein